MTHYSEFLTNAALAERLAMMVENPRNWAKADRDAMTLEAAKRLASMTVEVQAHE